MDIDALLADRTEMPPSGPDLAYDPVFHRMEQAGAPRPHPMLGADTAMRRAPDWSVARDAALAVLQRSHDLRAAALLANVVLRTDGLSAFVDALTLLAVMTQRHWETCHPARDTEEWDLCDARRSALALLFAAEEPFSPRAGLWGAPVARTAEGTLRVGDLAARCEPHLAQHAAPTLDETQVDLLADICRAEVIAAIGLAHEGLTALERLQQVLPGSGSVWRLGPHYEAMTTILRAVVRYAEVSAGAPVKPWGGA
ncbi:MAG: type VI secretion system ImpA family N-terminal domain-containing protein [Pseudomonadota bacterium]